MSDAEEVRRLVQQGRTESVSGFGEIFIDEQAELKEAGFIK